MVAGGEADDDLRPDASAIGVNRSGVYAAHNARACSIAPVIAPDQVGGEVLRGTRPGRALMAAVTA